MLYAALAVIARAEPVQRTFWEIVQQSASFLLTLLSIAVISYPVARKLRRNWKERRVIERKAAAEARRAEMKAQVQETIEAVVSPLREQIEDIHKTTHVNGGKSNPPTLRDEVNHVGMQVQQAIQAIGAIAVNQSSLSARFDDHEREGAHFLTQTREALAEHGIELPDVPEIEQ